MATGLMRSLHPFRVRYAVLSVAGIMIGCQPDPPLESVRSCTSGFSTTLRGTVRSSWPTYGADPQRTSVSLAWCKGPLKQAVSTGHSEPVAHATHLAVAWLSQTVVVVAGDQMAVLGLRDGRVQWTGQAPGNGDKPSHSPVVAEGRVYMVRGGTVHALACE